MDAGSSPVFLVEKMWLFSMSFLYSEYIFIFMFSIVASILPLVILLLSVLLSVSTPYSEKLTPYECGFDPFEDARNQFDIRFYLVAILFLVFDLEASFLFPWSVTLSDTGSFSFWVMVDFIVELVVGYIYVWKVGALEWE